MLCYCFGNYQGEIVLSEPFGKHSAYSYKMNPDDFSLVTQDEAKIKEYKELGILNGDNPYWYWLDV